MSDKKKDANPQKVGLCKRVWMWIFVKDIEVDPKEKTDGTGQLITLLLAIIAQSGALIIVESGKGIRAFSILIFVVSSSLTLAALIFKLRTRRSDNKLAFGHGTIMYGRRILIIAVIAASLIGGLGAFGRLPNQVPTDKRMVVFRAIATNDLRTDNANIQAIDPSKAFTQVLRLYVRITPSMFPDGYSEGWDLQTQLSRELTSKYGFEVFLYEGYKHSSATDGLMPVWHGCGTKADRSKAFLRDFVAGESYEIRIKIGTLTQFRDDDPETNDGHLPTKAEFTKEASELILGTDSVSVTMSKPPSF